MKNIGYAKFERERGGGGGLGVGGWGIRCIMGNVKWRIERCPVMRRGEGGEGKCNCNQYTHAALRSSYELSFKRLCVPDRIGIWK